MPTTEGVEELLVSLGKRSASGAAGGKRARREPTAAAKKGAARPYQSTRVRGPGGKFVSGLQAYRTPEGKEFIGVSERSRLKTIRAQRKQVLLALREARARRLRDGTIARLRAASRQLLARSKLTRGL